MSSSDSSTDSESGTDYKLPPFRPEDPHGWFEKTEKVFKALDINNDMTRFKMVIMTLDKSICEAVYDSIIHHPPVNAYRVLKYHVLEVLSPLVWRNKRKELLKISMEPTTNKKKKKREPSSSSSSSTSSGKSSSIEEITPPPARKRPSTGASGEDARARQQRRPRSPTPRPKMRAAKTSPTRKVILSSPAKNTVRLAVVKPSTETSARKPVHERIGDSSRKTQERARTPQRASSTKSQHRRGTNQRSTSSASHSSRGSGQHSSRKSHSSGGTASHSSSGTQQSKGTCQRSPSATVPMEIDDCEFPPDDLCYFHRVYGKSAEKCKPDCKLWSRCRPQPPQQQPPQPPQQQQKNVEGQSSI